MKNTGPPVYAVNDEADPGDAAFWRRELREQCEELGMEWTHGEATRRGKQASWLAAYARTATRTKAAAGSGVSLGTVKKWETEDPIFASMVPLAKEAMSDLMVSEARRRAVDGVSVALYDRHGNHLGDETKYSDPLLMFLLKGTDYAQRWATKVDGAAVSEEKWRSDFAKMLRENPDALEALDRLADKMVGGSSES